jgi:GNAT superfamily N-acetyltransferase
LHVRRASLDDTAAISELARSRIGVWQRLNDEGQVENVPYEALSIYERWLHGGPWMSIETGALQLSHLLRGGGIPIVAVEGERVVGYAEAYTGVEPAPYGRHMHLGLLAVYVDETDTGADDGLFDWLFEHAREQGYKRLTANCAANDERTADFYERHGMGVTEEVRRMMLSAKSGQVFYKAVEHPDADADQIQGWYMRIGRSGSARYQWEALWNPLWDAIPEVRARKTHRLSFSAAGNEAFVLVRQQLYRPRTADVFCWTPKPPSGQLITAIRDWAQREGYRKLSLLTVEDTVKTLGLDAEPDGYREYVYAVDI